MSARREPERGRHGARRLADEPTRAPRPRKRFGQNFLHDPGVIARIVSAIAPRPGEPLVEIGPGRGALTEPLLAAAGRLQVIELDRDLAAALESRSLAGLDVHQGDALDVDLASLAPARHSLRLIGNLPYNVSTPLLFRFLEQAEWIRDMHFMLQKEVVERMTAVPGSKTYGRLSVMLQMYCDVERVLRVAPGAFHPAPKVDSAVVRLVPLDGSRFPLPTGDQLTRVTRLCFQQRRKTLRNGLRPLLDEAAIASCALDPGARPETVSLEGFARLAACVGDGSA